MLCTWYLVAISGNTCTYSSSVWYDLWLMLPGGSRKTYMLVLGHMLCCVGSVLSVQILHTMPYHKHRLGATAVVDDPQIGRDLPHL